jgi:hypothetical protein
MEAIPKEVIKLIEDNFIKLSFKEKKKCLKTFYLEQPFLTRIMSYGRKFIKEINADKNPEYLFYILYQSYKYYAVEMPEINYDNLVEAMNIEIGNTLIIRGEDPSSEEKIEFCSKIINQDNLIDYIISKLDNTTYDPVFYSKEKDTRNAINEIITLLIMLNNVIKEQLGDEAD